MEEIILLQYSIDDYCCYYTHLQYSAHICLGLWLGGILFNSYREWQVEIGDIFGQSCFWAVYVYQSEVHHGAVEL